ncbi:hypothetical protein [uncultured Ellagibacter sp.]|uniref:hypothetical protein n=1 Tax=uncultured Ellagibacter sp. TaxID=2137580 RepID=UPI0025D73458|nr:hypothetical protein [uncultured Ellagibacter sp.]
MTNYASVEAMTRMITSITKTIQAEQVVVESLRKDYQAVGLEWNDSQYEKLGPVIDDAVRELSGNQTKLSECITRLQLLRTKLEEYLSTTL